MTDHLWLDLGRQILIGHNKTIPLTTKEFQLLVYLLRREGMVVSREALLENVWGSGYEGSEREVDVYVRYVRKKIEPDPSRPGYILSVWGRGYQYERPTRRESSPVY